MRKLILILVIAAAAGALSAVPAQNSQVLYEAQRITGDRLTVAGRTPRGAKIFAVNRPTAATLAAIDRGLTDLFAVARRNGYSRKLNFSDYTVYIGRADRDRDSA